jgi:hypothetical protein
MRDLKELPDLSRSFAKMKLQDQLDAISDRTIFGLCIRSARMRKQPLQLIAQEIMEQFRDNPPVVLNVVGQETIDLIKRIYYE